MLLRLKGTPTLFAALGFFLASVTSACSCIEFLTETPEALKKSALVFTGEVTKIATVMLPQVMYVADEAHELVPGQYMTRRGIVTFRVIKQWKGSPTKTYVILAAPPPARPAADDRVIVDCDVHFEVGKKYLVFATDGYSEANACAPTGLLESQSGVVRELDRLTSAAK